MENTLENKARYFAQHWGQEVHAMKMSKKDIVTTVSEVSFRKDLSSDYLYLTSLSSITDEDAIEIIKIFGKYDPKIHYEFITKRNSFDEVFRQVYFNNPHKDGGYDGTDSITVYGNFSNDGLHALHSNRDTTYWAALDFLRSKGYALPWMSLSVEQLIEYGWLNLSLTDKVINELNK